MTSVAGTAGTAGAGGIAGAGGVAGVGAGTAGAGGAAGTFSCDVAVAMQKSCSRSFCHDAATRYADLDLTNLDAIGARLLDQPALHGDIRCSAAGATYRECTPEELPAKGCPTDSLLIDSQNFANSWVVKKLNGEHGTCGDAMPLAPGNAVSNGWNEARRLCLLEYFQSLIPAP